MSVSKIRNKVIKKKRNILRNNTEAGQTKIDLEREYFPDDAMKRGFKKSKFKN